MYKQKHLDSLGKILNNETKFYFSVVCILTCIGYLTAACTNPGYLQGCAEEI